MNNENADDRFGRLAKSMLEQLCIADNAGRRIEDVQGDISSSEEHDEETEELFRRRVDWCALFGHDFEYTSNEGQVDCGSFLHLACRNGREGLVREITEEIFTRSALDGETRHRVINGQSRRFGRTPLHEAVQYGHNEIVLCLLACKACRLDAVDCNGATPLHLAVIAQAQKATAQAEPSVGDVSIIGVMLSVADSQGKLHASNSANSEGQTPTDLAIDAGHAVLKEFFLTVISIGCSTKYNRQSPRPLSKAVVEFQMSVIKKLLPFIAENSLPAFLVLAETLGLAIDEDDLCLSVEVLTCVGQISGQSGLSDVVLTPGRIYGVLWQALHHNSSQLVELVYLLSKSTRIQKIDMEIRRRAFRSVCTTDTVDVLSTLCSKDDSLVKSLGVHSLARGLQAAMLGNAQSLLTTLCTRSDSLQELSKTKTATFDSVLQYAWKHHIHRLITFLMQSPLSDAVEASLSQQTTDLKLDFLNRELGLCFPDPKLVALCACEEVLKECSAKTCNTIAKLVTFDKGCSRIQKVCEAGLLRRCSQDMKRRVLYKAAEHGAMELSALCIEAGALRGLTPRWTDPSPIDAAKRRGHDRLARRLQRAMDDMNLLSLGDQPVDSLLVRVGGPPGAGKSTLVESLKTTPLRGAFRWESQADEGIRNFLVRTKGIKVHVYKDEDGTPYHILDLGGHDDFAAAHQLFIGQGEVPIINTIVISSLSERIELQKEMMKWCAFYASRYRPPLVATSQKESDLPRNHRQPVVVVATRLREAERENRQNVIDSFGRSKQRYGEFLDFQDGPVFVDARKSWADATKALRKVLVQVKTGLFQRGLRQPALCGDVQKALPEIRKSVKGPLIFRNELSRHVAKALSSWSHAFDHNVLTSQEGVMDAVLRKLSDAAEIVSFQKAELAKYLVIEPQWLLSHIVGILMSPENFPPPHVVYQHGRVKRSLAEAAVSNPHVPGKDTLEMVAQLGLCILEEEDMIVPSKLDTERPDDTWIDRADLDMYFGIKLSCERVPMAPALFPQLQVRLYNKILELCGQMSKLWKDGVHVTLQNSNVEGLLEAQRDQMAINVAVRGSSKFARDAYQLLHLLREQVLFVAEEFSPGSDMSLKILSSKELRTLAEKGSTEAPSIAYEEEAVKEAMEDPSHLIRPRDGSGEPEDPFSLMALPSTHILMMSQEKRSLFCDVIDGGSGGDCRESSREELARRLNLSASLRRIKDSMAYSTEFLLDTWSHQSAHNTVELLIEVVTVMQHEEAVGILKAELDQMTTTTITKRARKTDNAGLPKEERASSSSGTSTLKASTQPIVDTPSGFAAAQAGPAEITTPGTFSASLSTSNVVKHTPKSRIRAHSMSVTLKNYKKREEAPTALPQMSAASSQRDATSPLQETAMLKIADCFSDFFDCQKLAVFLDLAQGSQYANSLRSADPHGLPSKFAFSILLRWKQEKRSAATGTNLYSVLRDDLQMPGVAEKCERDLLLDSNRCRRETSVRSASDTLLYV